jgi:hypothetical protein
MVWSLLQTVIFNLIPAFLTFNAALEPTPEKTKTWLIFWSAHCFFSLAELAGDAFLFFLPLYHLIKGLIIIWLVFFGGAARVYEVWLVRVLDSYEGVLERGLGQIQTATASSALGLASAAVSKLQDAPQWVAAGAAAVMRAQAAGAMEGALAQPQAQVQAPPPPGALPEPGAAASGGGGAPAGGTAAPHVAVRRARPAVGDGLPSPD